MSDDLQRQFDALAPPDIVPGVLTRDVLDQFEAMAGRTVDIVYAGAVIEDVRGVPCAVEPSTTVAAEVCGLTITRADADRLGITESTYAHVHIADRITP